MSVAQGRRYVRMVAVSPVRPATGFKAGMLAGAAAAAVLCAALAGGRLAADLAFPEPTETTYAALVVFGDDVDVVDFNLTAEDCAEAVREMRANRCDVESGR